MGLSNPCVCTDTHTCPYCRPNLTPPVLAEDLRSLADHGQVDAATREMLKQAADRMEELDQHRIRRTLGGPPAPFTDTWTNRVLPGGVHADYQGLT